MNSRISLEYPIVTDCLGPEGGGSEPKTAVDDVLAYQCRELPWDYRHEDLAPLHLQAFNERLRQRREQVKVLDQRASQLGIDEASSLEDVALMMFSANVYKSYPDSFLTSGRWSHLLRWLDSLSTHPLVDIDVEGCADVDEFMARVLASGFRIMNTSGTSGKPSLFPQSFLDFARMGEMAAKVFGWMFKLDGTERRAIFYTGNRSGNYAGHAVLEGVCRGIARRDAIYCLFEEPMLTAEVGRIAALNKAMAAGTATPGDIEALRQQQERSQERARLALDRFCDELVAHSQEPIILYPQVYVMYIAMKRLKETNRIVSFHPDSKIGAMGGTKNNKLPDGFMGELADFYGLEIRSDYGQSEILAKCPSCDFGRYHLAPNLLLLLLDESGERVLNLDPGQRTIQGLAATFDVAIDGRWGGVMSNDWLTVDYGRCPCGLQSPAIVAVNRLDAVKKADDDKVNCAGRIEMYIRGATA